LITAEQKFEQFLNSNELEYTSERKIIIRAVLSFKKHFNVDQLFERLTQQGHDVSRSTIYRAIPLLVQSGLIKEAISCQGKISYEYIYKQKHHNHLICLGCGKIIEFQSEGIERIIKEVCQRYKFDLVEYRLGIKGYCEDCRSEGKGKGEEEEK
jgi:Fur family transcriptional regulator, ferric uptake regulator